MLRGSLFSPVMVALSAGALASLAHAQGPAPAKAWTADYSGPAGFGSTPQSAVADSAGNIYVTGASSDGGESSFATIKYGPDGTQLWARRYVQNNPGSGAGRSVKLDPSGNAIVGGSLSGGVNPFADFAVLKYTAAGDLLWTARFNGPGNNLDGMAAMDLDAAGNAYLVGQVWSGVDYDIGVIKVENATGDVAWYRPFDGFFAGPDGTNDAGADIDIGPSGDAYVTGFAQIGYDVNDEVNIYGYAAARIDPAGNVVWYRVLSDLSTPGQARAIRVDVFGDAYVTGSGPGGMRTLKVDGDTGAVLWEANYNGRPGSGGTAIEIGPDGDPVVGGMTCLATDWCMEAATVVKFRAENGGLIGGAEFHGDDPATAGSILAGLTLDSKGNIFFAAFTQFFDATRPRTSVFGFPANNNWFNPLWYDFYLPPGNLWFAGKGLGVDALDNLIMFGDNRVSPVLTTYRTVKYRSCSADFNFDGQVDFFDYLDFVSALDSEQPAADINGDSQVDFFDYLDFAAAFDAECL